MTCPNCGANLSDTARFCTSCGSVVNQNQQTNYQQPNYQQNYQQPPYQQPNYQQPNYQQPNYQQSPYQQPPHQTYYQQTSQPPQYQNPSALALPMKWYKFLTCFSLIAGAVLNGLYAILAFSGSQYGGYAEEVYEMFEELQVVDVLYGFALIALAGFGIYVRQRLAGFYENGPKMLNVLYIASLAVSIFYLIVVSSIVGDVDFTSAGTSMAFSAIMIAANTSYFKKRAHLFVN